MERPRAKSEQDRSGRASLVRRWFICMFPQRSPTPGPDSVVVAVNTPTGFCSDIDLLEVLGTLRNRCEGTSRRKGLRLMFVLPISYLDAVRQETWQTSKPCLQYAT